MGPFELNGLPRCGDQRPASESINLFGWENVPDAEAKKSSEPNAEIAHEQSRAHPEAKESAALLGLIPIAQLASRNGTNRETFVEVNEVLVTILPAKARAIIISITRAIRDEEAASQAELKMVFSVLRARRRILDRDRAHKHPGGVFSSQRLFII